MTLPPSKLPEKKPISMQRIVIWIVVAAAGLYLVITGLAGVIAKG